MSTTLNLFQHDLLAENFNYALYCNRKVTPWENYYIVYYDDVRGWGYDVKVPANSYVRVSWNRDTWSYTDKEVIYVIDDVGVTIEIITLNSDHMIQKCICYMSVDSDELCSDTYVIPLYEKLKWHFEEDHVIIDDCDHYMTEILIPSTIHNYPVKMVHLKDFIHAESLIIEDGITQLDFNFNGCTVLNRLELPQEYRFMSAPDYITFTPWFTNHPIEPIYLGGYYCGTPGGGWGKDSELVIQEGTIGTVTNADYHCFWHKIVFPDSLKFIGHFSYTWASCLEEIIFPKKINYIGLGCFQRCDRLQSLYLPDGLVDILDSFEFCQCLKFVSMPAKSWIDYNGYFALTKTVELRDGEQTRIITRDIEPQKLTGTVNAYSRFEEFEAGGYSYGSIDEVEFIKVSDRDDYLDQYMNPVKFVYYVDTNFLLKDGHYYTAQYWFIRTCTSISCITLDTITQTYIIKDDITYDELPERIKKRVKDFFYENKKE